MKLRAHGRSDKGRIRPTNQDHFLVGVMHKTIDVGQTNLDVEDALTEMASLDAQLLVVADGVGGVGGGERASQSAVFTLATYIGRTAACHYDPDVEQEDEFIQRLERALHKAHAAVQGLGAAGRGPATTLTVAMVIGTRAYIAHVGDSRVYHCRRGRLRLLTRDQTVANMLADSGVTRATDDGHLANILSSAIGSQMMTPSIGLMELAAGDSLVLCTDGLTKHVDDEAIASVLTSESDPEIACNRLVEAALDGGGSDNVTVIVAYVPR